MAKKTKALKLVFSVGESKTMTVSLLNPKDGLTKASARALSTSRPFFPAARRSPR